ncbi:hypothetical protein M3Y94_00916800 [Aphelenchoides besseyi]|nr:hypothetical protein M3Y94_00916800 [Aphelenchoides besseyi]
MIEFTSSTAPTADPPNENGWADLSRELAVCSFPQFDRLRRNGTMCDVRIECQGSYFRAHRVILAATIPFFDSMFNSELREQNSYDIPIKEIPSDTLEQILNFVYTGRIYVDAENVESLMKSADFLQMQLLSRRCSELLRSTMSAFNVLGIRRFASIHNSNSTLIAAERFIRKHFVDVTKSDEFLQLTIDELVEILESDELHVEKEEQVCEAALRWLADDPKRHEHAAQVLKLVRMPLLEKSYLIDEVAANSIVHASMSCRDLIDEAKDFHLFPERRENYKTFKSSERCCSDIPGIIFVCGGLDPYLSTSRVEMYDPLSGQWMPARSMNSSRTRIGVAVVNRLLYVFGGFNGVDRLRTVEVYNYRRNAWSRSPALENKRSAMSVAVVEDQIFVCGGYDGEKALKSVEIFDTNRKKWTNGPSMTVSRCAAAATALNGFVYVIGGHNGFKMFETVERYNPTNSTWEPIAPMKRPRCRHAAATFKNRIWVVGGYDSVAGQHLQSVEIYDPQTNVWIDGPELLKPRSRTSLVVTGPSLCVIGGHDGTTPISSMEILVPEQTQTDETTTSTANRRRPRWHFGKNMHCHEGGVGVAVIPARSELNESSLAAWHQRMNAGDDEDADNMLFCRIVKTLDEIE